LQVGVSSHHKVNLYLYEHQNIFHKQKVYELISKL
jgi:hypothetical protein